MIPLKDRNIIFYIQQFDIKMCCLRNIRKKTMWLYIKNICEINKSLARLIEDEELIFADKFPKRWSTHVSTFLNRRIWTITIASRYWNPLSVHPAIPSSALPSVVPSASSEMNHRFPRLPSSMSFDSSFSRINFAAARKVQA